LSSNSRATKKSTNLAGCNYGERIYISIKSFLRSNIHLSIKIEEIKCSNGIFIKSGRIES
jgi:hypothetical protein